MLSCNQTPNAAASHSFRHSTATPLSSSCTHMQPNRPRHLHSPNMHTSTLKHDLVLQWRQPPQSVRVFLYYRVPPQCPLPHVHAKMPTTTRQQAAVVQACLLNPSKPYKTLQRPTPPDANVTVQGPTPQPSTACPTAIPSLHSLPNRLVVPGKQQLLNTPKHQQY